MMREYVLQGLFLLLSIALLASLAQRLRFPIPIFLVLGGLIISLIPGTPQFSVEPDLIFLVFLPPLLYEAAWFSSWRELWRWRRIVLVMAFGLVLLTSTAVALSAQLLIPGFTLALGFLLGGIISPPDAVAATSVLKNIDAPKSTISILEGESLINDASSLIVFRFALSSVETGAFVWQEVALSFVLVSLMGAAIGLLVGGVFYAIHRWFHLQSRISILTTFLAPYIMYLTAEHFHYSGVIAVVSGGLLLSSNRHRILQPTERVQGTALWATVIFIINGLVFMLIGLELPVILRGLDGHSLPHALFYGLAIAALVIVVRLVFALVASVFTNFIGRFITVAVRNAGWRGPVIVGWAGMRGVVSLAAALSIPLTLPGGAAFPQRDLLLFITFVVILVTLVLQGLSLPYLIRWLRPEEPIARLSDKEQEATINRRLQEAALRELNQNYAAYLAENPLLQELKSRLELKLALHQPDAKRNKAQYVTRYTEAVGLLNRVKRDELLRLRQQDDLDEEVLRKVEAQMDLEEEKNNHQPR